jgi:hypothetical protein
VQVADAVHVRAGVEQRSHRVERGTPRREVQREGVVADVAGVWIGAVLEQEPQGVGVAYREVKPGRAVAIALAHQAGLAAQEAAERANVAGAASGEECVEVCRSQRR